MGREVKQKRPEGGVQPSPTGLSVGRVFGSALAFSLLYQPTGAAKGMRQMKQPLKQSLEQFTSTIKDVHPSNFLVTIQLLKNLCQAAITPEHFYYSQQAEVVR